MVLVIFDSFLVIWVCFKRVFKFMVLLSFVFLFWEIVNVLVVFSFCVLFNVCWVVINCFSLLDIL